jgi:hypothetical protein
MRVTLSALLLAGGLLGSGLPLQADESCCSQGKALPWKLYNTGVKWRAALSKDPARWAALAAEAVKGTEGMSILEREVAVNAKLHPGKETSWKEGIAPAIEIAKKEGKLLMFFQLVGDLDLEGC